MSAIEKLSDLYSETILDDEVVLMRVDNGEFFALSGTGVAIWRLIDGQRDAATIRSALAEEYSLDERQAEEDIGDFLSRLKEAGLIAER